MSRQRRSRETRARIQAVAVELFTEQGYEKTSLREIAERLDVTKAALYYHFKSKEDIVASLVEDYVGQIDDLIAWGREQPRTAPTRAEILRRYVGIVTDGHQVFRMLHQNQAAASSMSGTEGRSELFKERLRALVDLLSEPGATLAERLRPAMALGGISVGLDVLRRSGHRHRGAVCRRAGHRLRHDPCHPARSGRAARSGRGRGQLLVGGQLGRSARAVDAAATDPHGTDELRAAWPGPSHQRRGCYSDVAGAT